LVDELPSNEILKCAFIRGLSNDTRSQLIAACSLNKMTLEEVVDRARSMRKTGVDQQCMLTKAPFNKNKGRSCFKCKREGHIARDCRTETTSEDGSEVRKFCYICGDVEHLVYNCPKRMKAPKTIDGSHALRHEWFPKYPC